ncbi:PhoX family protein [Georgenia subflava]|uniref:DUF839 domain-containing protein n=1 Tax=Georgenia subflava TaxID=1622177 RepID=A0A6N7EH60_9MICO|nr:PhoX family phosphatase [Georgenia subflava]MPV37380.1 DUF839 domain-containing protein [Georgenia subflava]
MSTTVPGRRPLPLLPAHDGGRSALTCRFRCGDACFHPVPNTSANEYFGDVAARAFSRRSVLRAGAVVAAATAAVPMMGRQGAQAAPAVGGPDAVGLRFDAVAPNFVDAVSVPAGYTSEPVIRWGDKLFSDAADFDPANLTAAAQARQFGYNNDHVGLLPLEQDEHLMVVNHEYTDEVMMFGGYDAANPTREQVEVSWAAHGLSVVAVTGRHRGPRNGGLDPVVDHPLNRRFTATDEFELTGPVAGAELVRTSADPSGRVVLGTLNNCAGGLSPWGTWLTAEENFNQYFANADGVTDSATRQRLARYGLPGGASERKWERFDTRFDLSAEPNEVNRFGWIVEVDPYDPTSTPRKRTALGRFKHEAATVSLTPGRRAALYMGDDERFDYLYKFVTRDAYRSNDVAHNATLLDNGTLYVARFADDGSGEWIPLVTSTGDTATSHVPGMTGVEVLLFTRQAGDAVGATTMDRPEDVEPSPKTGVVYVALTNNTARSAAQLNAPNPRPSNKHGHVIELVDGRNDATSSTFTWDIFLLCGNPEDEDTYFAGYDKTQVSPISCPDNLAFDRHGNLWISTDGQNGTIGANDALHAVAVKGSRRGQVKTFLTVPRGGETCGPIVTDERVLVAVQHPGEYGGASFETRLSSWPDGGGQVPRPSVVVAYRLDGKKIGHG